MGTRWFDGGDWDEWGFEKLPVWEPSSRRRRADRHCDRAEVDRRVVAKRLDVARRRRRRGRRHRRGGGVVAGPLVSRKRGRP